MKKILLHTLSALLVLTIIYFLGREFASNWEQIKSYTFNFRLPVLLLASATYVVSFIVFSFGWYTILRYFHHPIPFYETSVFFCLSQPAKYMPGKIWIAVARMKLCAKHGIPNSITFLTTGMEAVMEILGGAYISVIAILQLPGLGKASFIGTFVIVAIGFILLIPRIFYFFINLYLKIVRREPLHNEQRVSFRKLLALQCIYIVGMLFLGLSQVFFLQSFAPVSAEHLPFLVSIGVLSIVASILAVFSPAGLGVREGVWYLALKTLAASHVALIYVLASRIWMIVIEAILAFIALPMTIVRRRPLP